MPACSNTGPTSEPAGETRSQAVTGCSVASAGGGWINQAIADQTGRRFHVELDATPSNTTLDAVVGLGAGSADGFTDLAAIVRFKDTGTFDARAGSEYKADAVWSYQAGATIHVRFDVDPQHQLYSVWVGPPGSAVSVGQSYPYRTEQAGLTHLNNLAAEVDASAGTLQICNVTVVTDNTTGDGCLLATAGEGPASLPLPDATVLDTVTFSVQPDGTNVDAVVGLSADATEGFSDLAAAVRLAPNGIVDVRDGNGYRADLALSYTTDVASYRLVADLSAHRYSVFANNSGFELARQYGFRAEQVAATHLDHLGVIVDGDQGSVRVCRIDVALPTGVAYTREGASTVFPQLDDGALIGALRNGGSEFDRLDAAGHKIAAVSRAGLLVGAPDGTMYSANGAAGGSAVVVQKLAASGETLWQITVPVQPSDNHPTIIDGLLAGNGVTVTALGLFEEVVRISPEGAVTSHRQFSSSPGSLLADGFLALNRPSSAELQIVRLDIAGQPIWQRDFTGAASITALTVDPEGNVLFGGRVPGQPDFGGGPIAAPLNIPDAPATGYVVKLSSTGDHVFSKRLQLHEVNGVASNGSRVVVSGTFRPALSHARLFSFDASGGPGPAYGDPGWAFAADDYGNGGSVVMGPSGRVWWSRSMVWPPGAPGSATFVIALEE